MWHYSYCTGTDPRAVCFHRHSISHWIILHWKGCRKLWPIKIEQSQLIYLALLSRSKKLAEVNAHTYTLPMTPFCLKHCFSKPQLCHPWFFFFLFFLPCALPTCSVWEQITTLLYAVILSLQYHACKSAVDWMVKENMPQNEAFVHKPFNFFWTDFLFFSEWWMTLEWSEYTAGKGNSIAQLVEPEAWEQVIRVWFGLLQNWCASCSRALVLQFQQIQSRAVSKNMGRVMTVIVQARSHACSCPFWPTVTWA